MTTLEVAYANIAALRVLARQYPLSIHCGILGFAFGGGSEGLERRLLDLAVDERGEASIVLDEPRRGTTVGLRIWSPSGFVRSTLIRKVSNGATLGVMELVGLESGLSVARLRSFGLAFGLTSAELSVLALLGADLSLSEIAEARAVSTETVRNQCSGLLQKTRCRRLSELVRLVLTFCMGTNTF